MNPLTSLYSELIYRPLLNGLVFIYASLPYPDLGLAILALTALVRLALHPTLVQTVRTQAAMARLQPKLREIQERFKADREEQGRRVMALYREAGVHPLSGCLPVALQLPVLIGLYQVFWKGIRLEEPSLLYPFVARPEFFSTVAFGLVDLAQPSWTFALAAGASQLLQSYFLPAPAGDGGGEFGRAMRWQVTYFLPFFIVVISWSLPSAIAFYWTVLNLLAIVQQLWIQRRLRHEYGPRTPLTNP